VNGYRSKGGESTPEAGRSKGDFDPLLIDTYEDSVPPSLCPLNKSIRIEYLGEYPSARRNGWSKELQGITHDNDSWFLTQRDKLWKFPRGHDFNVKLSKPSPDKGILMATIPEHLRAKGYDHMGDIDYHDGKIYVPLEHKNHSKEHLLITFDAETMEFIGSYALSKNHMRCASWVAVDKDSGLIFMSNNEIKEGSPIVVYSKEFVENDGTLRIKSVFYPLDENGKRLTIKRVQGGVISADKRTLFLVSDVQEGGILAFDLRSKRLIAHHRVRYKDKFPFYEELQGITIWPEEGYGAEYFGGNLHMIMLDNDACDDDFYLKHFQYGAETMVPAL
jgi:hypothetical protein